MNTYFFKKKKWVTLDPSWKTIALEGSEGGGCAACWYIRLRFGLAPSSRPCQLQVPGSEAGSSPHFNPSYRGSPASARVASYFTKSNRGSWLPPRPQEEGNIWGGLSSALELGGKKNILDQVSFAQGPRPGIQTAPGLRDGPAAWRRMEVLFHMLHVQRTKRHMSKTLGVGEEGGGTWTVLKEEKFGESSGAPAGHGLATVTQAARRARGPPRTLLLLWAPRLSDTESLNDRFILIEPQSGVSEPA